MFRSSSRRRGQKHSPLLISANVFADYRYTLYSNLIHGLTACFCNFYTINGKHFSSFSLARIVPIISSFSYEASDLEHCNETLSDAFRFDLVLIAVGTLCFVTIPAPVLHVFVSDERVVEVGQIGFRFIGVSFLPMVTTLIFPVYFQAAGAD